MRKKRIDLLVLAGACCLVLIFAHQLGWGGVPEVADPGTTSGSNESLIKERQKLLISVVNLLREQRGVDYLKTEMVLKRINADEKQMALVRWTVLTKTKYGVVEGITIIFPGKKTEEPKTVFILTYGEQWLEMAVYFGTGADVFPMYSGKNNEGRLELESPLEGIISKESGEECLDLVQAVLKKIHILTNEDLSAFVGQLQK